jgi:asparagine synthase (glutamine-hydrolysing)
LKPKKWYDLKSEIQNQELIKDPHRWFKATFDDSVRLRMVSDVPVGVLFCGGLDSSSILASLKAAISKHSTFYWFQEEEHNELICKMLSEKLEYGFHNSYN